MLAMGDGKFPYELVVCERKKGQRESCAKYSVCHLFSLLWHLCKSPLLYCLPFDNKAKSQWFIVFISEVVQNSCSMVSKSIR